MSSARLVSKYISSAEHVFGGIQMVARKTVLSEDDVRKILDHAKAYLDDAKYYRDQRKFEVSLTSVAYCEGLLDALRLLGTVKFEWPTKKRREK